MLHERTEVRVTPEQALISFFENQIAYNKHLSMQVTELSPGRCQIVVPFQDHLIGDPFRPALHGGVLSALADAAGGLAVFSQLDYLKSRVSTIDLRVDYLRPGKAEDITCDAHVVRAGNKVAVTNMELWQGEPNHLVADCRAVYNVVHKEISPGHSRSAG